MPSPSPCRGWGTLRVRKAWGGDARVGKQALRKSWRGAGLVLLTPDGYLILGRGFVDKVERRRKNLWPGPSFSQELRIYLWNGEMGESETEHWVGPWGWNIDSNGSNGDWTQCRDVWGPIFVPSAVRQQMEGPEWHTASPSPGTHEDCHMSAPIGNRATHYSGIPSKVPEQSD